MISRVWLLLIEVCSESNKGHNSLFQRAAVPDEASLGAAEFEVMDGEQEGFQDTKVCLILLSAWKIVRKKQICE